jgi:hypothetical protein
MRHIDETVLLLDRRDRVGERHPARNLLVEEEADHLALVVGLDLLTRYHRHVTVPRELERLHGACEHVVVGDRHRAEPFGFGLVEQERRRHLTVVRRVSVHM